MNYENSAVPDEPFVKSYESKFDKILEVKYLSKNIHEHNTSSFTNKTQKI